MTFERIQSLIEILPDDSSYFREVLNYSPNITDVNRFLCAYKDLMFGFRFISTIVLENIKLPLDVEEESLNKLYLYLKYGEKNKDITYALSIHHPSNKNLEDCIRSVLFTDESYKELSNKLGIPERVIRYYEELFYNIRDRKNESLFIANIVYPDSRIVEFNDNYTKEESISNLLIRSAYNNGIDDNLYMIGLKTASDIFSGSVSSSDSANRLESSIMANGLFLARNGYLNQRNIGISGAKNMLIAAKQSGLDQQSSDIDLPLGDAMWQALQNIKGPEKEHKLELIEKNELAKLSDNTKDV